MIRRHSSEKEYDPRLGVVIAIKVEINLEDVKNNLNKFRGKTLTNLDNVIEFLNKVTETQGKSGFIHIKNFSGKRIKTQIYKKDEEQEFGIVEYLKSNNKSTKKTGISTKVLKVSLSPHNIPSKRLNLDPLELKTEKIEEKSRKIQKPKKKYTNKSQLNSPRKIQPKNDLKTSRTAKKTVMKDYKYESLSINKGLNNNSNTSPKPKNLSPYAEIFPLSSPRLQSTKNKLKVLIPTKASRPHQNKHQTIHT
jgi:hypothetical protein